MSDAPFTGAGEDTPLVGEIVADAPLPADLPDDPEEAVRHVVGLLHQTREEADSRLADLQRLAAEFENYRKRVARDRDEFIVRATQSLVAELLPVLDSLDGALAAGDDHPLFNGVRSTRQLLGDLLAREGLEVIPAVGLPFDPEVHEAVSGGGSGHLVVTAELRRGYKLGGRVLRPSLVEVTVEDPDGGGR